jgi:hypothetical protein
MATPISAVVGEKDLRIRIEEAVMKASKNKAVPPKHKHERNILFNTILAILISNPKENNNSEIIKKILHI